MSEAGPRTRGEADGAAGAFSAWERVLALRYLRARKYRFLPSVIGGISFLAIAVAVATLIVVMSVMNGFHIKLVEKIVGVNGHLFLQPAGKPLDNYDKLTAEILKQRGITHALPVVEGAAGVVSRARQSGVLVRGVREADLRKLPGIGENIRLGSLDNFDKSETVIIGQDLAEALGVGLGDRISLLTARGEATPFGMVPRIRGYTIAAIFKIGMSQFDNIIVFLPFEEAQDFFNRDNEASFIEAFVENPENMRGVRETLDKTLSEPLMMVDWQQRNPAFFDALKVERSVMFFILSLFILVAALGIVSGVTMLVSEKSRAIAILRTMGATRGSVMRVFLMIGAIVGICGTLFGIFLGLLMARNLEVTRRAINRLFNLNLFDPAVYQLAELPSVVRTSDIVVVVIMAFVLSLLATLYPSWRSGRVDPVEALRYE
ncbi:MAG: lipoprotein-releasing ABC transporter permease subunit [Alphaproteobacteria bacterium]|nr:lipoprotein-releasing ABC transporter permease subunit [Alphaproteobacteria bacterium]